MIKNYFRDFQIGVLFLGIICLFPLFKIHYNSYTIIVFALVCIWNSLRSKEGREKVSLRFRDNFKIVLTTTLIVFVFALSLLYSHNLDEGLSSLQHLLALIIFPVIIFLFMEKISKKELNFILSIFVLACILHFFYLHYNFYLLGLYEETREAKFYDLPFREAIIDLKYESQHPSYVSLWYSFCVSILLNKLPTRYRSYKTIFAWIFILAVIVGFVATIILLSSRMGVISTIIVVGIYIYMRSKKVVKWVLFLTLFVILAFSFKNVSYLSSRFIKEFQDTEMAPPEGKKHNSINIRIGIYQCALNIIKSNPLIGVGIGDVQDALNACYDGFDTDAYAVTKNSHNYFFNVLLASGIIGLLVFLYMFYVFFRLAIIDENYVYICFLLIVSSAMLFENVLSRNHGVLFFALINTLFVQFLNTRNHAYRSDSVV